MYRKRDNDQSVPDIEKYINEKLMRKLPEVNIEVDMNADVEMNMETQFAQQSCLGVIIRFATMRPRTQSTG